MSTVPTMIAGTNAAARADVVREKLYLRLRVSTAQDFSVDVALKEGFNPKISVPSCSSRNPPQRRPALPEHIETEVSSKIWILRLIQVWNCEA